MTNMSSKVLTTTKEAPLWAMFIILAGWVILVVIIYFAGVWPGCQCENSKENTKPWFEKYPEYYPARNSSTLRQLHVILRHGDRTNLKECQYPNDPYLNETYAPVGMGELTNLGKRRIYELGRALRHQYDDFLGDYDKNRVAALSSELGRSRNSLELVLAGLYPPKEAAAWMKGMPWRPIEFRFTTGKDNLLGNPRRNCDRWPSYYAESQASFRDVVVNHSDYFDRLAEFTGWHRDLLSVNLLYNSIVTNLAWGLELDEKLKEFWPEPTTTLNKMFWKAFTHTEDAQIAGGGALIQKILEQSQASIANESEVKLHIYSASDFNVQFLLRILGQEVFDNPPYGSHVILELRADQENGPFYVKFFYRADVDGPLLELKLPDCQAPSRDCLFDDFLRTRIKFRPAPNHC